MRGDERREERWCGDVSRFIMVVQKKKGDDYSPIPRSTMEYSLGKSTYIL
jgi:hypothetical protein